MWLLAAIAVLALGIGSVMLGWNILPSVSKAREGGTFVPLLVVWALVATSLITSLVLARFILSNKSRS